MDKLNKLSGTMKAACFAALVLLGTGALVLLAAEKAEHGYLGVSVQRLPDDERGKLGVAYGVQVVDVEEESAAAKAGIQEDDVIQSVNGEKIRDAQSLIDVIGEMAPGSTAKIGLWRGGKAVEVKAVLGKREPRARVFRLEGPLSKHIGSRPYLGVNLFEPDEDLAAYFSVKAGEGVLVTRVEKDTPAAKAGIKAGDVIVQVGETAVKESEDIVKALAGLKKGDSVAITVVRRGKKETLKAEPDFSHRHGLWRILGGGKEIEAGHLQLPELDIEIPEIDMVLPAPPEPPDVDVIVRRVHEGLDHAHEKLGRVREKLDRARIRIDERLKRIGENYWI